MTKNEFIEKANAVHNSKYDYSQVEYKNNKTPVAIVCPIHGVFWQRPDKHLQGQGCPFCSKTRKYSTEDFIARSRAVHGDKYDYSKSVYKNANSKIKIICPEHGEFEQLAGNHLKGKGCPKCKYNKAKTTLIEHYGVNNPMKSDEIKQTYENTIMEMYGVTNVAKNLQVRQSIKDTCNRKYGTDFAITSDIVRCKIEDKFNDTYGCKSPFGSDVVRCRSQETMMQKYGTDNFAKSAKYHDLLPEILKKRIEPLRANNSFTISNPENVLYDMLVLMFGKDDVIRQYSSDVYPFACDFYIKSRDMYIELNASWTHNTHWFGTDDGDEDILSLWSSKNTVYYDNAIMTWHDRDIKKRNTAQENNLNYVVFWDNNLLDAKAWFAFGCPDSNDYIAMYNWCDSNIIDLSAIAEPDMKSNKISSIAKYYQHNVFYKREYQLWNENHNYKGIPLRMYLLMNRMKYMTKSFDKINANDVLRGFTISGIYKGYTAFDVSLMNRVLDKYDITSVFDPCAGWGERLINCYLKDITYRGVDINLDLRQGYDELICNYNMQKQSVEYGDSASVKINKTYDAVITCPPYGNIEIYSDKGAENLSENKFIEWWCKLISNVNQTNCKYFCFQINQKYKSVMSDVVLAAGYKLIDEFTQQKVSHFNKHNRVKKEYESMLVFERI